jgi:hypothetical protein
MVLPSVRRLCTSSHERRRAEGVEPGGRLVEEEQLRVSSDPQRQVQAAALAAGEGLDRLVPLLGEPDEFQHLLRVAGMGVRSRVHPDGLQHPHGRAVAALLQNHADPLAELLLTCGGVESEHGDPAGVAFPVALQDLAKRGLAGAVGPKQPEHLAAGDLQIDSIQCRRRSVGLPEPAHGHRWSRSHVTGRLRGEPAVEAGALFRRHLGLPFFVSFASRHAAVRPFLSLRSVAVVCRLGMPSSFRPRPWYGSAASGSLAFRLAGDPSCLPSPTRGERMRHPALARAPRLFV